MDRTKIVAGLMLALCAACTRPSHVTVASKNFTEQVVLGEILSQQIERRLHIAVDRRLNLGGTLLTHEALVKGDIDLYPEYTGTALTAILKQPPAYDSAAVFSTVADAYRRRWHLEWLPPLGFVDTFAMIIRGEDARAKHIATLSEAAQAQAWRLGAGPEFASRPDGLDGLLKTYGLRSQGTPVNMDLGLLYAALDSHRVDMIAANSTDGLAAVRDVVILRDDRHYFPPYDCSVVVRQDTLARFPELRAALQELSGKFTDATMRKLNHAVDGEHRSAVAVAEEFLKNMK
ncbi:MAG TPA: glycine betaine ABC transporter substrate-binding protein [Candidatus Sulfopaludibacter sp.]|jgi:glycine betaine/choline ABC-type transport system substrate-binding protein|nr:glycine betaine ABC transporter substrate-binding protein [Candidatus Sulfopaludibacter sp.]